MIKKKGQIELYEITARHKKNHMTVSMFYESIDEAKRHNPDFENFRLFRIVTKVNI